MSLDATKKRALWALLLLVPAPTIGVAAALLIGGPVARSFWFATKVWQLALPIAWLWWVDRQRISVAKPGRDGMALAAASGLVIGAIILAAHWLIGRFWIDVALMRQRVAEAGFGEVGRYALIMAYVCVINALLEEYVWRWFVFRKCEVLMPPGIAVLASAVFFTFHHVVPLLYYFDWRVAVLALAGVFIGGTVWSWFYLRYRSVWPGYVSHAIVDAAVFGLGWYLNFG